MDLLWVTVGVLGCDVWLLCTSRVVRASKCKKTCTSNNSRWGWGVLMLLKMHKVGRKSLWMYNTDVHEMAGRNDASLCAS